MTELFLDHADRNIILPLLETGEFVGVTSNPEILNKNNVTPANVAGFVKDVFAAGAKTLCMQAWGLDAATMTDAGRKISSLDDRIIVKVPWTLEGRKAGLKLINEQIPVLATAVLTVGQVISAQASGVTAISPYLDSIDREYGNGIETLKLMEQIDGPGKMIVADVHSPQRVAQVFSTGVAGVTTEPPALVDLCDVAAALKAAERFETFNVDSDWVGSWGQ